MAAAAVIDAVMDAAPVDILQSSCSGISDPAQAHWVIAVGGFFTFCITFGVGANNVANAFATSVGSGAISLRTACLIAAVCEFSGATLMGAAVTKTLKGKIIAPDPYDAEPERYMLGMLSVMAATFLWLVLATWFKLPVSTTHTVIGGLVGYGFTSHMAAVRWAAVIKVVISWVTAPGLAGPTGALLFTIVLRLVLRSYDPFRRARRALPVAVCCTIAVGLCFLVVRGPLKVLFDVMHPALALLLALATALALTIPAALVVIPRLALGVLRTDPATYPWNQTGAKVGPKKKAKGGAEPPAVAEDGAAATDGGDMVVVVIGGGEPEERFGELRTSSQAALTEKAPNKPAETQESQTYVSVVQTAAGHGAALTQLSPKLAPEQQQQQQQQADQECESEGDNDVTEEAQPSDPEDAAPGGAESQGGSSSSRASPVLSPAEVRVGDNAAAGEPAAVQPVSSDAEAAAAERPRRTRSPTTLEKMATQQLKQNTAAMQEQIQRERELKLSQAEGMFRYLEIVSASFATFAHGANGTANAISPFAALWGVYTASHPGGGTATGLDEDTPTWVFAAGGVGIVLGLALWGWRIIDAMGRKLVTITPTRGFTIQMGSALIVMSCTAAGIPVSSTHCQIGSTVGVGLAEGKKGAVNWPMLGKVVAGWVVTLIIAAGTSATIYVVFIASLC